MRMKAKGFKPLTAIEISILCLVIAVQLCLLLVVIVSEFLCV